MVFYEAPHKLQRTLKDMLDVFGDRQITICRELTKLHEEIWRTTVNEASVHYDENPPKGEFVLVVEGAKETGSTEISEDDAVDAVLELFKNGASLSEASKQIAREYGLSKSVLYKAVLERKE